MSLFKDVNVVQYHVTRWERAKQFYADVPGWPVAFLSDEAGWMEFGEEGKTRLAIRRREESSLVSAAALRARSVRCDDAVVIPGRVAYGVFYDPDGNRVQFASSQPGM